MAQLDDSTHIGQDLARARMAKSLSCAQVAKALNLQETYITAIEALDRDALPSIGYVLGYVRAYADFVELNGTQAVARFKTETAVPENLGMRDRPHFVPQRKIKLPRGFVPALSVLGCAAMLAVWYGTNTEVIASTGTTITINTPAQDNPIATTPLPATVLTIKAVAPSWVQIKDPQGNVVLSRILTAGESYQTETDARMVLSARDGGALELYAGDNRLGLLGQRGLPLSNVAINAATVIPEMADIPLVPLETSSGN